MIEKVEGKRNVWRVILVRPRMPAQPGEPQPKRKRKTWTVHGPKSEAIALEAAERIKMGKGAHATTITLNEMGQTWLDLGESIWEHSTWAGNESTWRIHIQPEFGGFDLDKVTPAHVDAHLSDIANTHSHTRANAVRTALLSIYQLAVRRERIPHNLLRGRIAPIKKRKRPPSLPTEDQVSRLLEVVSEDLYWHAWFSTLCITGARPAELCALRWDDVALGDRWVRIESAMKSAPEGFEKGATKTVGRSCGRPSGSILG